MHVTVFQLCRLSVLVFSRCTALSLSLSLRVCLWESFSIMLANIKLYQLYSSAEVQPLKVMRIHNLPLTLCIWVNWSLACIHGSLHACCYIYLCKLPVGTLYCLALNHNYKVMRRFRLVKCIVCSHFTC